MSRFDDDDVDYEIEPLPPVPETRGTLVVNIGRLPEPPGVVYVGRGSPWGNPYSTGDRDADIARYEQWFHQRISFDPAFRYQTLTLKGCTLGCFCRLQPGRLCCHAQVIAGWLDGIEAKEAGTGGAGMGSRSSRR